MENETKLGFIHEAEKRLATAEDGVRIWESSAESDAARKAEAVAVALALAVEAEVCLNKMAQVKRDGDVWKLWEERRQLTYRAMDVAHLCEMYAASAHQESLIKAAQRKADVASAKAELVALQAQTVDETPDSQAHDNQVHDDLVHEAEGLRCRHGKLCFRPDGSVTGCDLCQAEGIDTDNQARELRELPTVCHVCTEALDWFTRDREKFPGMVSLPGRWNSATQKVEPGAEVGAHYVCISESGLTAKNSDGDAGGDR